MDLRSAISSPEICASRVHQLLVFSSIKENKKTVGIIIAKQKRRKKKQEEESL